MFPIVPSSVEVLIGVIGVNTAFLGKTDYLAFVYNWLNLNPLQMLFGTLSVQESYRLEVVEFKPHI